MRIRKRRRQANGRGQVTDSNVFEALETLARVDNPSLILLVEKDGALSLWESVSSPAQVVRMLRATADLYEWDRVKDAGASSTSPEDAPAKESTDG